MRLNEFSNSNLNAIKKGNLEFGTIVNIFNKIWGGKNKENNMDNTSEFNAILDLIPDGVLISNHLGKVVATNSAYHALTGYTKEQIVGKHASEIPAVEITETKIDFWNNIRNILTRGEIDGFEFSYRHADGTPKWGEARAKLFRTGFFSGGAIAVLRDITERKQKDKQLVKILNELEMSNKELDDYTYAVSHDLKAPLRTIKSFGTFLLEDYSDVLDEEGQMYLHRMMGATIRMKDLIEDLLTISRIGRMNVEDELIDFNDIINTVKLDLNALIEESGGEILTDNLPKIVSKQIWLKQLLFNLISNGLKFNKEEAPKIWIDHYETPSEYVFSVRDNGIGIDKKHHDKIFKIFERLHKQEDFSGTGAGLTICKKIVDNLGGRIWVESELGKGSTFFFTIPKVMIDPLTVSRGDVLRIVDIPHGDTIINS